MKTIGIVGSTGWISTLKYYRLINEEINKRLGGYNSAKCILYSLNFADIDKIKKRDPDQKEVGLILIDAAKKLKLAGAD
ncbi:MAG: hypothetical protein RDU14_00455 [Melioribacteraceae bacterium]|nr:hypothetical protein [Melioribacteraceae bacterium]